MSRSHAAIDTFFEYAPGEWLLVGWSTVSELESIFLAPALGEKLCCPVLPVRLPRPDVVGHLDDPSLVDCGFAAFISHPVASMVASVVIADLTLPCHPISLSPVDARWFDQLGRIFRLLRLQYLSCEAVELLLQSGLQECIHQGESFEALQKPWESQPFQRFSFGITCHGSELTYLLTPTPLEHDLLIDHLQRLCSEDLFLTSVATILVVIDQSWCPSALRSRLEKILDLQRIKLDLIVADEEIGVSQCVNLGVYVSSAGTVAFAPCLSAFCSSNGLNLLYHSSILEPQRLIVSSWNAGSIPSLDDPIMFQRETFFGLGALGSIGFSVDSVVQALIHKFRSDPGYGIRSVFELFDFDCLKRADCPKSRNRLLLEPWQSAIEESLFGD